MARRSRLAIRSRIWFWLLICLSFRAIVAAEEEGGASLKPYSFFKIDESSEHLELKNNFKFFEPEPDPAAKIFGYPVPRHEGKGSIKMYINSLLFGVITTLCNQAMLMYCTLRLLPFLQDYAPARISSSVVTKPTRMFTPHELNKATSNYLRRISVHRFGSIYYGRLLDGTDVAVKVFSEISSKAFIREMFLLTTAHHRNMVSLLGLCNEQQILVYEYMAEGTLREHLYGADLKWKLSWRQRLEIVLNVAKGLEYIHHEISPSIIHQDISNENILLDAKLVAKLANFHSAELNLAWQKESDGTRTTFSTESPCCEPEYNATGRMSESSDVYRFGVILLEIITGKAQVLGDGPLDHDSPSTKFESEEEQEGEIVEEVSREQKEVTVFSIIDPDIANTCNLQAVTLVKQLAKECMAPRYEDRPDIDVIVDKLSAAIEEEYGSTQGVADGYERWDDSAGASMTPVVVEEIVKTVAVSTTEDTLNACFGL